MSFPVENIRALCKKRGTSLAALERSLGFGNGVIAGWETAKSYPPYDHVSAQFGNPEQLVLCTFQHPQQPV